MTNLEIIKYLATNNSTRLAELLDDVWCCAWNFGANTQRTGEYDEESDIEFSDSKWLEQEATASVFFGASELEEWSKAINPTSTLVAFYGTESKVIDQAIDEIKLLETLVNVDKYSESVYNSFRKEVCARCNDPNCLRSKIEIYDCYKFENYYEI